MRKSILLVEDNGMITEDLRDNFQKNGYEVKIAYSYETAVDCWIEQDGNFDTIILDLHISPDGLNNENIIRYQPFYGIAVYDFFQNHNRRNVKIEDKCIIYSGFTTQFEKFCRKKNWNYNIYTITKSGFSVKELIQRVEKLNNE